MNNGIFKIFDLFKKNKNLVFILMIVGSISGYILGKFLDPLFEGRVIIAPSTIENKVLTDSIYTIEKMQYSTFYSKNTLEACNTKSDRGIKNLNIILTKDTRRIELTLSGNKKEEIISCLNYIEEDIKNSESELFQYEIEKKQKLLSLYEKEKKLFEQKKIFALSPQYFDYKLIELESSLNPIITFPAKKVTEIVISKKPFPSPVLGFFYGLIFSLFLITIFLLNKKSGSRS